MRVTTGSAKGRRLEAVPGDSTRPITDRVKQAVFSILGAEIIGKRLLDLFGGTGAVGIEALSRGAARVVFIEMDSRATRTIGHNLQATGLAERARVVRGDAFKFLSRPGDEQFDYIYVAPPQYRRLWVKALRAVDSSTVLAPDGLVIVQIHPKEREETATERLRLMDERQYGSTLLLFYTPAETVNAPADDPIPNPQGD
jgi:16S rRNA (guanine(966)-N(2))-methyltransferase RsmD